MADDYRLITTTVFSTISEVRLYAETVDHIRLHQEVPIELPMMQEAVATAIQNPTHIESSHSNSYVFVDGKTTNASGDPFRVPIKMYQNTTSAYVKTAYFGDTNLANVIWRQP